MLHYESYANNLIDYSYKNSVNEEEIVGFFNGLYEEVQHTDTVYKRRNRVLTMIKLYERFPFLEKFYEYISNAGRWTKKFIKRITPLIWPSPNSIIWNNIQPLSKGIYQFYLIRCVDIHNNIIFSKIGTTTRETTKRMKEHLRYYAKNGVSAIYVDRLYNCGNIDPEGLESLFRAHYIKKYKGTFKKNDRFENIVFDLEEADKMVNDYLKD